MINRGNNNYGVTGEIPYGDADAVFPTAGNRFAVRIVNSNITSKTQLPSGNIAKTTNKEKSSGWNVYGKNAFEDDGSLIAIFAPTAENKNSYNREVKVDWEGEGEFATYTFNLTQATLESAPQPQPTGLTPIEVGDTAQYVLFNDEMPLADVQSRVQEVPLSEFGGAVSVLTGHVDAMSQDFDLIFVGNFDHVGEEWIGAGLSAGQASKSVIWSAAAVVVDRHVVKQGWQDSWSDSQTGFSWNKDTMTLQFPVLGTMVSVNANLNGYVFGKVTE